MQNFEWATNYSTLTYWLNGALITWFWIENMIVLSLLNGLELATKWAPSPKSYFKNFQIKQRMSNFWYLIHTWNIPFPPLLIHFFRSFDDLSVRNSARWSPFVNWTISSQEGISVDNYSIIKVSKSSTSSPIKVRTVGPSMHRKKLSGIGSLMSSTV